MSEAEGDGGDQADRRADQVDRGAYFAHRGEIEAAQA